MILFYYRPQLSWGKVIFSQACVKNSVHGGGVSATTPLGSPPSADTPLGRQTPLGSACWDTVNTLAVRVLLILFREKSRTHSYLVVYEKILVHNFFFYKTFLVNFLK